jgi:predicted transcriptional regulator
MGKDKTIQVRVDQELAKKLQMMAEADNRKLSDFIRVQLIKLVKQKNKK